MYISVSWRNARKCDKVHWLFGFSVWHVSDLSVQHEFTVNTAKADLSPNWSTVKCIHQGIDRKGVRPVKQRKLHRVSLFDFSTSLATLDLAKEFHCKSCTSNPSPSVFPAWLLSLALCREGLWLEVILRWHTADGRYPTSVHTEKLPVSLWWCNSYIYLYINTYHHYRYHIISYHIISVSTSAGFGPSTVRSYNQCRIVNCTLMRHFLLGQEAVVWKLILYSIQNIGKTYMSYMSRQKHQKPNVRFKTMQTQIKQRTVTVTAKNDEWG